MSKVYQCPSCFNDKSLHLGACTSGLCQGASPQPRSSATMSTTLGGGEVLVVEEEVESKLGEEEAREEREKIRRTADGTSFIAKQNCDSSSLGQNYLVTESEIALLLSVTLVFFNDQMSQTIVEDQEEAAFAEQVARRVGRKFHGGEENKFGAHRSILSAE